MASSSNRWVRISVEGGDAGDVDAATPARGASEPLPAEAASLLGLLARMRGADLRIDRMSCADVGGQVAATVSRPIDTVLCSLLDADATAPLNAAVAADHFADVSAAVSWLARATGATRTLYVADRSADAPPPPVDRPAGLLRIAHAYPQLHPSLLLKIALRRRLSPGRLPTDAGVVAIDAAAARVLWALINGVSPDAVVLPWAVHDARSGKSAFADAPAGLTLGGLISRIGFDRPGSSDRPVIQLGPRLLNNVDRPDVPLKRAGDWTIHLARPVPAAAPEPCTRCGWCHAVCPADVEPVLILEASQTCDRADGRALADRAGLDDCVRCGLCQFVCPSKLPLLRAIDAMAAQ